MTWESVLLIVTYVRPHPHDGVQGRALVAVHRLVAWRKVCVLEQLTNEKRVLGHVIRIDQSEAIIHLAPVPTQPLDVLIVCLAQPSLQAPVHRPVSEKYKKCM